MNKIKPFFAIILLFFGILGSTGKVLASEFNFAVNPVIPANQIDKEKTYFDLKMTPGEEQTIEVQLRNDTENDLIIETAINSATTNLNGVVEYGTNKIKADKSLQHNLKEYTEVASEIELPKRSEIIVPVKVKMPMEKFDGIMVGGITFKEKIIENKTTDSSDEKGLAIKNEYSYVVALLIRQNQTSVEPDLKLMKVGPAQVNARNVINVGLQNPKANYLNQLRVESKISKKGQNESLYQADSEGLQMAPNSNFNYPISLNGAKLEAGDYTMKMVAYGERSSTGKYKVMNSEGKEETYTYKWVFEKDFNVEGNVAKELNAKDVTIETNDTWLYILIGILIVFAIFLFLFLKRRKRQEEEKNSDS